MTYQMAPEPRLVLYCILSREAAGALEAARAHYAGADPRVEVLVERRIAPRRHRTEPPPTGPDRRGGTDRRRFVVPRMLAPLPPALAERTGPVRWAQRLLPVPAATEQLAQSEVVAAVRAGDPEAPTEIYWRLYE